MKCTTAGFVV